MFADLLQRVFPPPAPDPAVSTVLPPLAAALKELDIEVFSKEAVEKYKTDEKEAQFWVLLWTTPLGSRFPAKRYWNMQPEPHLGASPWDARWFTTTVGSRWRYEIALRWVRRPASVTTMKVFGGVPDYVVRKAEAIRDAIPGVTFETDTLQSHMRDLDPFLVAKLGDEEYYIEVWGHDDKVAWNARAS